MASFRTWRIRAIHQLLSGGRTLRNATALPSTKSQGPSVNLNAQMDRKQNRPQNPSTTRGALLGFFYLLKSAEYLAVKGG